MTDTSATPPSWRPKGGPADVVAPSPEGTESPAADEVSAPSSKLGLALKLGVVALVIAGVVVAWRMGVFAHFRSTEELEAYLQQKKAQVLELGVLGYVGFVAIWFLQPFGLPGVSLVIAASLVWPWPVAFALSMAGGILATTVGFSFARFVAREAVAKRIPKRFRKYDQRLADRAFTTILLLRLVFWVHPVLHVLFGTSKVKFRTHLLASALAYIPPFLVISYFGQRVLDFVQEIEGWHWVLAAVIVLKAAIVAWSVRRWMQRKKDPASRPPDRLATSSE